ncbi:hypothetical protein ABBQ38_011865 [Trebouxia sp. C0009 RCD-2024]
MTTNFNVSNSYGSAITERKALQRVRQLLCNLAQITKIHQSCHCTARYHTCGLELKHYLNTVPLAVSQTGLPMGSNTRKGIPGTATMRSASASSLSIVHGARLDDQYGCERSFETLAIPVGMDMTAARSAASSGITTAGSTVAEAAAAAAMEEVETCMCGWSRRRKASRGASLSVALCSLSHTSPRPFSCTRAPLM